jgi:hypothetical protein
MIVEVGKYGRDEEERERDRKRYRDGLYEGDYYEISSIREISRFTVEQVSSMRWY